MADQGEIVVVTPEAPPLPSPVTPMEMLSRALDRGADLTVLEKLMDLQERHEKNQARKAFDAAIAEAKAKIKPVSKNRTGNNQTKYADLSAYAKEVDPVLAAHGLSYRYRSSQDGIAIRVTCILTHRDGHAEETTLASAADKSGSKNDIQAIGSAVEYLKRYTLTLALGLSASNDDDGQAAGGDTKIDEEQAAAIREKIDDTGADIERFCRYWKIEAIPDLPSKSFKNAMASLDQAAKTRKAKTGGGA